MVSVKPEPSQEGNLVPYVIKPMADLPSIIKKRNSLSEEKHYVRKSMDYLVLNLR
jgi:hypothetical protein